MTPSGGVLRTIGAAIADLLVELLRAGLLLGAFASALGSLMGVAGKVSRLLDVAAHFALAGFLASALCLIVALAVNRGVSRSAAALSLLGATCWGLLLAPDYLGRLTAQHAAPGAPSVKIVQFNIWAANPDRDGATSAWILAQDPDVVVLEEVSTLSDSVVRRLSERYPFVHSCADPSPCGTVILSRLHPVASGGQTFAPRFSNLTWVTLPGPQGLYSVVGVHQSWPYPFADQAAEGAVVAGQLRRFDQASAIVTGDFNLTPWSKAMEGQDRRFGLQRRTRALPTFPARVFDRHPVVFPLPLLPLDHVYAGSGWRTVSVKRGPRLGSDHYPVVAVLRWEPVLAH